jgi:hypothetical protein
LELSDNPQDICCIIFATIDKGKIFASYFRVLAGCLGFHFLNAKDAKDGLMQ